MKRALQRWGAFLGMALGAIGCGDSEKCTMEGVWSVTATYADGDCVSPGEVEANTVTIAKIGNSYSVTFPDSPPGTSIIADSCSITFMAPVENPESVDSFGASGSSTSTLTVEGDKITGSSFVSADLTENGVSVGTCMQVVNLVGVRQ